MLLLQTETPATSKEIACQLQITPRMVRYSLESVEDWLRERGVRLLRQHDGGVAIGAQASVKRDLTRELAQPARCSLLLSPSERLHTLLLLLLTSDSPLIVKQLVVQLGISRPTVLKDMDKVQIQLKRQGLSLIRRPGFGFQVAGTEWQRRQATVGLLLIAVGKMPLLALAMGQEAAFWSQIRGQEGLAGALQAFFRELRPGQFRALVGRIEQSLQLVFSDEARVALILHLALAVQGVTRGRAIEAIPAEAWRLAGLKESRAVRAVAALIETRYQVTLPEAEIAHLTIQVLGAKAKWASPENFRDEKRHGLATEDLEVAELMVAEASIYLHPCLRMDRRLIQDLALHVGPVIHRLRYGLPIGNPLLDDVKRRYPHLYSVAQKCGTFIEERAACEVPDEEIGYIAMHLGAAMERFEPASGMRKRVLIVCGEGVATAWLLVSRMQTELPEIDIVGVLSVSEVRQQTVLSDDIDAVISTGPTQVGAVPTIVVSPLLEPSDKDRIRALLATHTVTALAADRDKDGLSLSALLSLRTVEVRVDAHDWREVVDRAGRLLLTAGAIEQRFIEAMQELVVRYGPYVVVAPGVALLHAHPRHGVKRLCVSLVTLENPVRFGHPDYDPVHLAFALAASDNVSHLKALTQLVSVIRDKQQIDGLRQATDRGQVLALMEGYVGALEPAGHGNSGQLATGSLGLS